MSIGWKIGQVWGVPIGLHVSWFLIFLLVTWSLAVGFFPATRLELPELAYWVLGAITSLLFFASVLLHELGHVYVALRSGIRVRGITLFIFGGVAQLEQDSRSPGEEFRIAIAGPLVSFALAGLFTVVLLLGGASPYIAAPAAWLANVNFVLAVFNLIPGYPLDGGRILKAIVWKVTGSGDRAARFASVSGQIVALGFIGIGIWTMFTGVFFSGLWLILIGWFLQNAAATSYAQYSVQRLLRDVPVSQVMTTDIPRVHENESLRQLVENHALRGGQRYFLVVEDEQPRGLLTLRNIAAVPQANWPYVRAGEIMVLWQKVVTITPDMELLDALRTLDTAEVGQVPVMENGRITGVLTRENVLHHIRLRTELNL